MLKFIIPGVIAFVVLILLLIFLPGWINHEWEQEAANLSIFLISGFLCLLISVMIGLTAVIAGLVVVLTGLLKKIDPLLDKVNETADTAKGTVAYVGEGVVSPLVKVSMILASIRGAAGALFRGRP